MFQEEYAMATKIEAINAYRPRLSLGKAATEERFMELITQRTTLSTGVVKNVQESEVETLIGLLLDGVPVHTGTAIYTPSIDLEGNFDVKVRLDARILRDLNGKGAFRGSVINAENIGKTSEELIAKWNEEHPDKPVV
jgi:hypothetical protein